MTIHRRLNKNYRYRYLLKGKLNTKELTEEYKELLEERISRTSARIKKLKESLYTKFSLNKEIRHIRSEAIKDNNIISVFDSVLTRTLKVKQNSLTKDIIVVQTYFFDILKDLIHNGFMFENEKYICFTASAGQIRTKKTVFIKEKTFNKYQQSLMCGLTVKRINQHGGVNINKYLAYLALCNSATEQWSEFDIDKSIVVDDMETLVHSVVDFIDDKTYEIETKEMDISIEHTDGCGMMLPRINKASMMVRLPWVKGLLVPFPFDKFIREENKKLGTTKYGVVKDIYGKEHDLINNRIEVIFTKSQFKMWKYYSSWDEYKNYYKKFKCHAGKCNEEESFIRNAKLNYQMLQTLTDITDKELETISNDTINNIINVGSDRRTMLKILGANQSNINKNYIQQALEIYPELLNDTYSREILKQTKKSMVSAAKSGKISISGKYTFISPDLYAFCEYLIKGDKNPKGLIGDGEVSCFLYSDDEKLDCLRSPHLYREHAVRNNKITKEIKRWFVTKNLYTSCHDPISKILMFDVDGDKSLVCNDKTIVEVAERNMKGINPLFYNMAKAEALPINNENVYDGLKSAYTGGNIGMISNDITKIWNSENVDLDVIKILCMENNFTIDYAKTLYKPTRPKNKKKFITGFTKSKTPNFFIHAKDKDGANVEPVNDSVVNRLGKLIPNPRIKFNALNTGDFDYHRLICGDYCYKSSDELVIDKYKELDLKKRFMDMRPSDGHYTGDTLFVYTDIRNKILEVNSDVTHVVNVLVEYLYNKKKSSYKTTLWSSFGDVIVDNLKKNVSEVHESEHLLCEKCGKRIEVNSNRKKYCESCWKIKEKEDNRRYARESMRKKRNVKGLNISR
ncbi:RNA dependent RNA polymerase [Paenibacillus sp. FSL H3-0286]|uniref:RNA dependent RNA polymerase n=1 Tax=Paenibacillus sp. FSL H3-0286 TaxID=2921427 RepID=UPI00324DBDF5